MTLPTSNKKSRSKRTERSEVHSRPKGVNPQDQSRKDLNRKLTRINQETKLFGKVQEELIRYQWENNFRPQWFIILEWNDLPTRYDTAVGHAKNFRNVFLTTLLNCNSPKKIPDPPARPKLVFFHERKPIINKGRQIIAFHTHLHLEALPKYKNNHCFLEHLIQRDVSHHVWKLLKSNNDGNKGVVIKPWVWEHHAFYNIKDYYRYKNHQDPDLVLDYRNSDLIF